MSRSLMAMTGQIAERVSTCTSPWLVTKIAPMNVGVRPSFSLPNVHSPATGP